MTQVRILFVCTGNACRSPLAEALFKKYRPDISVDSAGTFAYFKVIDLTRRFAEKEGVLHLLKKIPDSLKLKNLTVYDLIVAMEVKHKYEIIQQSPESENRIQVWNIIDPYGVPYEQAIHIFERIKSKVSHLAKSIPK